MDLQNAVVRILRLDGTTVGTGFVVADKYIITCAHVVEKAQSGPEKYVDIRFQANGNKERVYVEPTWWRESAAEDIAILCLPDPQKISAGVKSLLLGSSTDSSTNHFESFGYPELGNLDGFPAKGEIGRRSTQKGLDVLIIDSDELGPGMSGAPIYDTINKRVIGVINSFPAWTDTERRRSREIAGDSYGRFGSINFATPAETLQAICPELRLFNIICPYQGLAPFTEENVSYFFGREQLIDDLLTQLRRNPRFLTLIGPSGSGKTSVVQAGLFPELRKGKGLGGDQVAIVSLRPGRDPFLAFEKAGFTVEGLLRTKVQQFLFSLQKIDRLVLFIDQFEELFALCTSEVQQKFLEQFLGLLESGDVPITIIIGLRADFYGELLNLKDERWAPWISSCRVDVPRMRTSELREAILKPAHEIGLRFQDGLVNNIVEDAQAAEYPLPLLEFALTKLWEGREGGILTHERYQNIDRVTGALSKWAEDTYRQLDPDSQKWTERIFTRLIHYGREFRNDTRQSQTLDDLISSEQDREPARLTILHLSSARLLLTDKDRDVIENDRIEIVHDTLLWVWGSLQKWRENNRDFLRWRQWLQDTVAEWERNDRSNGFLLGKDPLEQALHWATEKSNDLNLQEHKFIELSEIFEKKQQRRTKMGILAAALLIFGLITTAGFLRGQAQSAENRASAEFFQRATTEARLAIESLQRSTAESEAIQQEAISQSQGLSAISAQNGLNQTLLSLLLAIQAGHIENTKAVYDSIYQLLPLLARPLYVFVHNDHIDGASWNSDRSQTLTWGRDGTAKVWNTDTGALKFEIVHGHSVYEASWNKNEDRIL